MRTRRSPRWWDRLWSVLLFLGLLFVATSALRGPSAPVEGHQGHQVSRSNSRGRGSSRFNSKIGGEIGDTSDLPFSSLDVASSSVATPTSGSRSSRGGRRSGGSRDAGNVLETTTARNSRKVVGQNAEKRGANARKITGERDERSEVVQGQNFGARETGNAAETTTAPSPRKPGQNADKRGDTGRKNTPEKDAKKLEVIRGQASVGKAAKEEPRKFGLFRARKGSPRRPNEESSATEVTVTLRPSPTSDIPRSRTERKIGMTLSARGLKSGLVASTRLGHTRDSTTSGPTSQNGDPTSRRHDIASAASEKISVDVPAASSTGQEKSLKKDDDPLTLKTEKKSPGRGRRSRGHSKDEKPVETTVAPRRGYSRFAEVPQVDNSLEKSRSEPQTSRKLEAKNRSRSRGQDTPTKSTSTTSRSNRGQDAPTKSTSTTSTTTTSRSNRGQDSPTKSTSTTSTSRSNRGQERKPETSTESRPRNRSRIVSAPSTSTPMTLTTTRKGQEDFFNAGTGFRGRKIVKETPAKASSDSSPGGRRGNPGWTLGRRPTYFSEDDLETTSTTTSTTTTTTTTTSRTLPISNEIPTSKDSTGSPKTGSAKNTSKTSRGKGMFSKTSVKGEPDEGDNYPPDFKARLAQLGVPQKPKRPAAVDPRFVARSKEKLESAAKLVLASPEHSPIDPAAKVIKDKEEKEKSAENVPKFSAKNEKLADRLKSKVDRKLSKVKSTTEETVKTTSRRTSDETHEKPEVDAEIGKKSARPVILSRRAKELPRKNVATSGETPSTSTKRSRAWSSAHVDRNFREPARLRHSQETSTRRSATTTRKSRAWISPYIDRNWHEPSRKTTEKSAEKSTEKSAEKPVLRRPESRPRTATYRRHSGSQVATNSPLVAAPSSSSTAASATTIGSVAITPKTPAQLQATFTSPAKQEPAVSVQIGADNDTTISASGSVGIQTNATADSKPDTNIFNPTRSTFLLSSNATLIEQLRSTVAPLLGALGNRTPIFSGGYSSVKSSGPRVTPSGAPPRFSARYKGAELFVRRPNVLEPAGPFVTSSTTPFTPTENSGSGPSAISIESPGEPKVLTFYHAVETADINNELELTDPQLTGRIAQVPETQNSTGSEPNKQNTDNANNDTVDNTTNIPTITASTLPSTTMTLSTTSLSPTTTVDPVTKASSLMVDLTITATEAPQVTATLPEVTTTTPTSVPTTQNSEIANFESENEISNTDADDSKSTTAQASLVSDSSSASVQTSTPQASSPVETTITTATQVPPTDVIATTAPEIATTVASMVSDSSSPSVQTSTPQAANQVEITMMTATQVPTTDVIATTALKIATTVAPLVSDSSSASVQTSTPQASNQVEMTVTSATQVPTTASDVTMTPEISTSAVTSVPDITMPPSTIAVSSSEAMTSEATTESTTTASTISKDSMDVTTIQTLNGGTLEILAQFGNPTTEANVDNNLDMTEKPVVISRLNEKNDTTNAPSSTSGPSPDVPILDDNLLDTLYAILINKIDPVRELDPKIAAQLMSKFTASVDTTATQTVSQSATTISDTTTASENVNSQSETTTDINESTISTESTTLGVETTTSSVDSTTLMSTESTVMLITEASSSTESVTTMMTDEVPQLVGGFLDNTDKNISNEIDDPIANATETPLSSEETSTQMPITTTIAATTNPSSVPTDTIPTSPSTTTTSASSTTQQNLETTPLTNVTNNSTNQSPDATLTSKFTVDELRKLVDLFLAQAAGQDITNVTQTSDVGLTTNALPEMTAPTSVTIPDPTSDPPNSLAGLQDTTTATAQRTAGDDGQANQTQTPEITTSSTTDPSPLSTITTQAPTTITTQAPTTVPSPTTPVPEIPSTPTTTTSAASTAQTTEPTTLTPTTNGPPTPTVSATAPTATSALPMTTPAPEMTTTQASTSTTAPNSTTTVTTPSTPQILGRFGASRMTPAPRFSSSSSTKTPLRDYLVYGIFPNKTIVRKRPEDNLIDARNVDSPYVIFGIFPDGRLVRKFPNGTVIPDPPSNPVEVVFSLSTSTTNRPRVPPINQYQQNNNQIYNNIANTAPNNNRPQSSSSATFGTIAAQAGSLPSQINLGLNGNSIGPNSEAPVPIGGQTTATKMSDWLLLTQMGASPNATSETNGGASTANRPPAIATPLSNVNPQGGRIIPGPGVGASASRSQEAGGQRGTVYIGQEKFINYWTPGGGDNTVKNNSRLVSVKINSVTSALNEASGSQPQTAFDASLIGETASSGQVTAPPGFPWKDPLDQIFGVTTDSPVITASVASNTLADDSSNSRPPMMASPINPVVQIFSAPAFNPSPKKPTTTSTTTTTTTTTSTTTTTTTPAPTTSTTTTTTTTTTPAPTTTNTPAPTLPTTSPIPTTVEQTPFGTTFDDLAFLNSLLQGQNTAYSTPKTLTDVEQVLANKILSLALGTPGPGRSAKAIQPSNASPNSLDAVPSPGPSSRPIIIDLLRSTDWPTFSTTDQSPWSSLNVPSTSTSPPTKATPSPVSTSTTSSAPQTSPTTSTRSSAVVITARPTWRPVMTTPPPQGFGSILQALFGANPFAPPVQTTVRPTSTTSKPTSTTQKPTSTTPRPTTTTSTTQKPTSTTPKPTSTTSKPSSTTQKPTSTTSKPSSTTQKPTLPSETPFRFSPPAINLPQEINEIYLTPRNPGNSKLNGNEWNFLGLGTQRPPVSTSTVRTSTYSDEDDAKFLASLFKAVGGGNSPSKGVTGSKDSTDDEAFLRSILSGQAKVNPPAQVNSQASDAAFIAALLKARGIEPSTPANRLREQLHSIPTKPTTTQRPSTTRKPTQPRPRIVSTTWTPSSTYPPPLFSNFANWGMASQGSRGNNQEEDTGSVRSQVFNAAIGATRAFSQFLGAAITGAAQQLQAFVRNGTRYAWSSKGRDT